jgi:nitrous oxidase accessory protein NosD
MFLLPVISHTVQSVPPVSKQIITVDITGNGDYISIKDAIANAKPADIIKIKPGLYRENTISINKKIELIGDDVDTTIIDCSGNPGIAINISYVDISNLQIINTLDYAISILRGNDGCTVSFCDTTSIDTGEGIDISSSYNTISHSNFHGYDRVGSGIKIQGTYNSVDDCVIHHFSAGILILFWAKNNKIVNCNIFDTENAVDIRIGSSNNLVTNCNLYSNKQGINIWQNSNNNSIYLNNIFKNDKDAIDENSNKWDNGKQGNYWDKYRGLDENNDSIGDTPYSISEQSEDHFPLMTPLLPDVVMAPDNLMHMTSVADQNPTFTWNPVLYSKGINGYYVKIDNNPETFIGDTTIWTSPNKISNGTHVFYVRTEGVDHTSSIYATIEFSIDTSLTDSDNDGLPDIEETKLGSNSNDKSDAKKIYPGGKPYYLVDINKDGSFDILYNQATKTAIAIEKKGVNYLLDQNGDGTWDYVYNAMGGSISTYEEKAPIDIWILLILVTISIISVIVWYYIKNIKGRAEYRKYKEYEKLEKPTELQKIRKSLPEISATDRRYTPEMIDETRTLLKLIQQDVSIYMDKLQQIEEQIGKTYPEKEKEKIYQETKKSEIKKLENVESEVDRLLSNLSKK